MAKKIKKMGGKKVKKGMHTMPDGMMMSDKEMQGMMKKKKTSHYRMS